jgi:quinol monooxygenase YgiN
MQVNLFVKPARRDEFLACIRANEKGTIGSEPLALEYSWAESMTEPNTFHFQEKYQGKPGFEAHQQTQHFADWEAFAGTDPFTKAPEVFQFQC